MDLDEDLALPRSRANTWPSAPSNSSNNVHPNPDPKKSTRRNAWGNMSYADLITQAIGTSAEKRLTLSQIYDWMVANVPYFADKGDQQSSAGWKNSIRHNLSLHNRFIRVQNEGTGKSSWWMLNPDAKPGKANRRRATLETSKLEKKRGRVKRKEVPVEENVAEGASGGSWHTADNNPLLGPNNLNNLNNNNNNDTIAEEMAGNFQNFSLGDFYYGTNGPFPPPPVDVKPPLMVQQNPPPFEPFDFNQINVEEVLGLPNYVGGGGGDYFEGFVESSLPNELFFGQALEDHKQQKAASTTSWI